MGWSKYKKVPILLAKVEDGYQQLNDSSMIISALSSYLLESQGNLSEIVRCYPSISYHDDDGKLKDEVVNRYFIMFNDEIPKNRNKEELEEERKWRKWADSVLVHTLSPNVYRTRAEAFQAFHWFSEKAVFVRMENCDHVINNDQFSRPLPVTLLITQSLYSSEIKIHKYGTRSSTDFVLPPHHLTLYSRKPTYAEAKTTTPEAEEQLKRHLRDWLLKRHFYSIEEYLIWKDFPDYT
ncbi:hypothetical protein J6590_018929 [Homalodisca vitripennis]|nr:hypothetical protein J6590_018929 [Homalodisca vitripennis]